MRRTKLLWPGILGILFWLTACSSSISGGQAASPSPTPNNSVAGAPSATAQANKRVQLSTFNLDSPSPSAGPSACGIAGTILEVPGQTSTGQCCIEDGGANEQSQCCDQSQWQEWKNIQFGGAKGWCDAKPVIYLYPTTDTRVSVRLTIPGTVTVSNPIYPTQTGWQDILAHPNGTFEYQNQTYRELFYETDQAKAPPPATGIVIQSTQVENVLTAIADQLGFLPSEKQEFVSYWTPRLQNLGSSYVEISLFSPQEKQSIDHVTITPRPDTFLQYIFYFKPLAAPIAIAPMVLPTRQARIGFTAVEWGGIVDQ